LEPGRQGDGVPQAREPGSQGVLARGGDLGFPGLGQRLPRQRKGQSVTVLGQLGGGMGLPVTGQHMPSLQAWAAEQRPLCLSQTTGWQLLPVRSLQR